MKFAVSVLCLFLFISCEEEEIIPKPEGLIQEEAYLSLVIEMQLLDAYAFTSNDSTRIDSLKKELFDYYNTTENLYIHSNYYYQSKVEEHTIRIDSVLNIIERERNRINQLSERN